MPAAQKWLTEIYENAAEGVSSAVTPELLPPSQLAWGKNIRTRGAKPGTRPSLRYMATLPSGLVQGASYFGVQGGMGVISIGGHIYRLRIGLNEATFEEIALPWFNSGTIKQVYMQQTVETLVIQDGQSNPILYDGSTAERSVPEDGGVPLGRQMAYGNGRLWVAINGKELVAGDIRSNVIGSELLFTETNYLSSGGTFFFPKGITGLNFIATTGTSDYGALLIYGNDTCDALRADITYRDLWAQTPGFITSVLRHTGCASHWSLAQVNQDLYWRDAGGGIRSIRSSLADESGAGNAPISREVSRLTDYDSQQLLPFCSTIAFNNRLLMTSSPRLNKRGGITWGSLISLDFAPISTMRGKSFPAYDGQWDGVNFTHLFQGQFNGRSRAFAVTLNDDGSNSLWEIMADGRGAIGDDTVECSDGSSTSRITCSVEYGRRSFGLSGIRKRLERCDVYLWALRGEVDMQVYWRTDNNQKWQQWDEFEVCAKDGDPEVPGASTHVWKNLLPQQRPQIKSFTIPSNIDPITAYSLITGFEFQIRLVWTGQVHIYKTILHSTMLDDPAWAMRDVLLATCVDNDVTGNQVTYQVPVSPCPFIIITLQPQDVVVESDSIVVATVFEQYDGPIIFPENAFQDGLGGYYSTELISGANRFHFGGGFFISHLLSNNPFPSDPTIFKGLQDIVWSGASTYDLDTDTFTNTQQAFLRESGALNAGSNWLRGPRQPQTITGGDNFDDLLAAVASTGGNLGYEKYSEGQTTTGYARRYYSTNSTPDGGFFAGQAMGTIWVGGKSLSVEMLNLIVPEDMGVPISRTGTPARTQEILAFDSITNTYTGTMSRAKVTVAVPAGKTQLFAEFRFLVTPTDLSQPYFLYVSLDYTVTPSTNYEAIVNFPRVVGASVYYVSGVFSFEPSAYLGYATFGLTEATERTALPASTNWPAEITFINPVVNAGAYDDYEDYTGEDGLVFAINTGYGWADVEFSVTKDSAGAYDDFENYPDGAIGYLGGGVGWAELEFSVVKETIEAIDDYESYLDGVLVDEDGGTGWLESGYSAPP